VKYLLDTNTCIRYINGRAPQIRLRLHAVSRSEVAISTITIAEMFFGAAKSQTPDVSLKKQEEFIATLQQLIFDERAARIYGPLRANLERKGTPIGANDMLIAAIALVHDMILVTHNVGEFGRIPSLKIEDWEI
jgi:tRNA(fMet)-specific endonuclease VapC